MQKVAEARFVFFSQDGTFADIDRNLANEEFSIEATGIVLEESAEGCSMSLLTSDFTGLPEKFKIRIGTKLAIATVKWSRPIDTILTQVGVHMEMRD